MNAGSKRERAIAQAKANAAADGRPRYVTAYNGAWWVDRFPPKYGPCTRLDADGTVTEYGSSADLVSPP